MLGVGQKLPAFTDYAGLYARNAEHKNKEPFDLPQRWFDTLILAFAGVRTRGVNLAILTLGFAEELRDELENITGCVLEAALTQRAQEINWQLLKDERQWRQGWL